MAKYTVTILPSALRQLSALPHPDQKRVKDCIDGLAVAQHPSGARKLKGASDLFRIRCGHYRVIYSVEDVHLTVLVIRIGRRRDVYRNL